MCNRRIRPSANPRTKASPVRSTITPETRLVAELSITTWSPVIRRTGSVPPVAAPVLVGRYDDLQACARKWSLDTREYTPLPHPDALLRRIASSRLDVSDRRAFFGFGGRGALTAALPLKGSNCGHLPSVKGLLWANSSRLLCRRHEAEPCGPQHHSTDRWGSVHRHRIPSGQPEYAALNAQPTAFDVGQIVGHAQFANLYLNGFNELM